MRFRERGVSGEGEEVKREGKEEEGLMERK